MSPTTSAPTAGVTLTRPAPRWVYFAVFMLSGFSGLIYESIWSHYLKHFLGHAAYAQTLVLIIFMSGLAIGSWLVARLSHGWRSPLLCYVLVEGIMGVLALVFHKTFVSMSDLFYFSLLPSIDPAWLGNLLKWAAAAALILPQSVLLGMTFPLMSTGVIRRYPDQQGGSVAMLYFTNSIGAAVGVLASGFWLIALVGLPGTIMTAGILNVAIALVVFVLTKLDPNPSAAPLAAPAEPANGTDRLASLFLVAAAITGASSFMYEIGWLRMLSLVLGSTTHSFELMLSAFITGLAFGGLWIKRWIDRIDDAVGFSGWVQVLMGATAVLTLPLYMQSFDWMAMMLQGLKPNDFGYALFNGLSQGITLIIMVPTTFLAGTTLPLFTHVLMRQREGERAIGRIYAANTVGAIGGVLISVHFLMPLLGLKALIGIAAALDVGLGLLLLSRSAARNGVPTLVKGALVGVAAIVIVMTSVQLDPRRLGSGVYRYQRAELGPQTNVLFYQDGKTASISAVSRGSEITVATNGKPDASIEMDPARPPAIDEITMVMVGSLPLAYEPNARRVANIGLGSGLTTQTLLGDPSVERVDTVEIEPAMVTAAHVFGDHVARTFEDPRSVIHIEDARTFFAQQKQTYDVIIAEPSNPWVSGVSTLFSDEFYHTIGNYLNDDGVLVQWLQLYEFNDELALSVLKGLSRNFADYDIYGTDNLDILIVAKRSGRLSEPSFDRLFSGPLAAELERVGLRGADDFLIRKAGSRAVLEALLADTPVPTNSDYFPFLDLNAGRARFRGDVSTLFNGWGIAPLPLLDMLGVADVRYRTVTPDSSFRRTRLIQYARTRLSALTGSPVLEASGDARDSTLTDWLRALRPFCGTGFEERWSDAVHALARDTLAYLDADEGANLLAAAVPADCRAEASEDFREWLDLYAAVAARNGAGMATVAEKLLGGTAAADRKRFALIAAMLGRLATHEPERVMALYEAHKGLVGDLRSSPDVRLILALAKSRHEVTTTEAPRSLL
jgi:spermidine synthase